MKRGRSYSSGYRKTKRRRASYGRQNRAQALGWNTVPRTQGSYSTIGEMKYYTTTLEKLFIGSSTQVGLMCDPTTILNLCNPNEGTDINERIGKKIHVFKLKVKGSISWEANTPASALLGPVFFRIMLIQDTQTNGAQCASENILTNSGDLNRNVHQFQNHNYFGRFKVLKDKEFCLNSPNTGNVSTTQFAVGGVGRNFKFNINFRKPITVNFNNNATQTIQDITDNSFHILCTCSSSAVNTFLLTYSSRACYKDK